MKMLVAATIGALALAGCAKPPSQNVYRYDEVGKTVAVSFGTIVSAREVDITGRNTGGGAVVGGTAGAIAGSQVGQGFAGPALVGLAGAVVGAAVGAAIEQAAADRKGLEYVVVLESGVAMTVVQDVGKDDAILKPGDRVIVQNSGGYQRVLPAAGLPTEIERPQGIKVVDPK